jgi:hypothetical protein
VQVTDVQDSHHRLSVVADPGGDLLELHLLLRLVVEAQKHDVGDLDCLASLGLEVVAALGPSPAVDPGCVVQPAIPPLDWTHLGGPITVTR